jgi:hypothetical protein
MHPTQRLLVGSQRAWAAEGQSALLRHVGILARQRPLDLSHLRPGWNPEQSCEVSQNGSHRLSNELQVKPFAWLLHNWALVQLQTFAVWPVPRGSRMSVQASSHGGQSATIVHVVMQTWPKGWQISFGPVQGLAGPQFLGGRGSSGGAAVSLSPSGLGTADIALSPSGFGIVGASSALSGPGTVIVSLLLSGTGTVDVSFPPSELGLAAASLPESGRQRGLFSQYRLKAASKLQDAVMPRSKANAKSGPRMLMASSLPERSPHPLELARPML